MFEFQFWFANFFQSLTTGVLYLGPETVMPLASIIAAVVGFLLIFWRLLLRPFKKIYRLIVGKNDESLDSDAEVIDAADEIDEEIPNQ